MANAVLHRVWEHSQLRGAARCLLVLLADVADQRGIAYPGKAYIAKMINESEDYTDKLIDKVIESGELYKIAGRGRGHVTRFAILVGLNDLQIAQLKGVLENPFSAQQKGQDSTPIPDDKRGKVIPLKGVLQSNKRGTLLDTKQPEFEASQSLETPIVKNEIHHDPSIDPPPPTQNGGGGGEALSYEQEVRKLLGHYGILAARKIAGQYVAMSDRPALDAIRTAVEQMLDPREPHNLDRIARRLMDCAPPYVTPTARASPSAPLVATKPNVPDQAISRKDLARLLNERNRSDAPS
jgi:hypothetical protein